MSAQKGTRFLIGPQRQQRFAPIPPDDDLQPLRNELKSKAATLQKYIHFEMSMKPHIRKVTEEVDKMVQEIDALEAKMRILDKQLEAEKKRSKSYQLTDDYIKEREDKVRKIYELEEKLKKVLEEKANYLLKAEIKLQEE